MLVALVLVGRTLPGFTSLADAVRREFKAQITTAFVDFPMTHSFRSERRQYDADALLTDLVRFASSDADRTVFITREDLFAGGLNFVFGLAEGGACLVSTTRLDPRFYGRVGDAAGANLLFRERMVKEVLHELGHTFGLGHCESKRCVMVFSNSIGDVDFKGKEFCARCQNALKTGRSHG